MKKTIFLDRDGVINADRRDYTWRIADFELLPGVIEAIQFWKQKGYQVIVITNQGGISKGLYTHDDVAKLHLHLQSILSAAGAALDDIYYCPHHPVTTKCLCRKPGSLLLEKAMHVHKADKHKSWFIGDMPRDYEAAEGAGIQGILIPANGNLMDILTNYSWE